jgi:hypothetical protein
VARSARSSARGSRSSTPPSRRARIASSSSLWTYRIEDGSLVQNGLKPGWTLHAAAFFGSGDRILLAVQRPDPPSYRLYQTRVGSSDWANLTDLVPTAYVEIIDLCPSPDGETLAVVSAAGGHSDLTVSRGGDRLVETQVYPGYVEPLGWDRRGTKLYVESDMPLHLGTTMELREKNAAFDASMAGGIDSDVYVIDVEDQVVEVAPDDDVPSPDVSPDGRFKLHLIAIDETVTGLFLTGR